MNRTNQSLGFTLIELLVVIVVIGILATITIPSFQATKGRSYAAMLKSDLVGLAAAEESYYYETGQYTTNTASIGFSASSGVAVTVVAATTKGWAASATHALASPSTCSVYYGGVAPVAPATIDGRIACQ